MKKRKLIIYSNDNSVERKIESKFSWEIGGEGRIIRFKIWNDKETDIVQEWIYPSVEINFEIESI